MNDVLTASAEVIFAVEKEEERTPLRPLQRQSPTVFLKTTLTWTIYHHQHLLIVPGSNHLLYHEHFPVRDLCDLTFRETKTNFFDAATFQKFWLHQYGKVLSVNKYVSCVSAILFPWGSASLLPCITLLGNFLPVIVRTYTIKLLWRVGWNVIWLDL